MLYSSQSPTQILDTRERHGDAHAKSASPTADTSEPPVVVDAPPTRRSDVLRHVFPRPRATPTQTPTVRVLKPKRRTKLLSSDSHQRRRVALPKVFTSLFHNTPNAVLPRSTSLPTGSSASSTRSRASSRGRLISVPSIDFVSPGAFIFSGPSLGSRSESLSDSTSRLTSGTGNHSDRHSLRRGYSDTRSMEEISILEGRVLEPCDDGAVRSMSDILLEIGTPLEDMELHALEDVEEDVQSLLGEALSQTSQGHRFLSVSPLQPASHRIPIELLQQTYNYLSPKDFNAARHTCRSWMRASLNRQVLVTMLQRGGWWSSSEAGLENRKNTMLRGESEGLASEEWYLSRHLSRECALSANWTGNGLNASRGNEAFERVSEIDFTNLTNGHCGSDCWREGELVFVTSVCSQFLLVGRDTLINIYKIQSSTLIPVTSVVCPRRVLSMSMDVSSDRRSVAALLEGRMGMVCELHFGRSTDEGLMQLHVDAQGHSHQKTSKKSASTSTGSNFEISVDSLHKCRRQSSSTAHNHIPFDSVGVHSNNEAISLDNVDDRDAYEHNYVSQTWNLHLRGARSGTPVEDSDADHAKNCAGSVPIKTGTSTFYRHLCSEDDPPRSVSICPQRRCVAFGCAAGIELHWIDALTGQSLSRWFPLTAPSDYLHFLAPRPGFESAKKLRLISSAAHPDDQPALSRKFFVGRPIISSLWGAFGFEGIARRTSSSSCDHYHAIPLSDGHHILFIDLQSSQLFIGCDAPLGGRTKLVRKVLLIPPSSAQNVTPQLYTAASEMRSGVRIAVAFASTIVFYSVPPDLIALSRIEQKTESLDLYSVPPHAPTNHFLNWWDEPLPSNRWGHHPVWPVALQGTVIGELEQVCELAVLTTPDITVWACALDAKCRVWQVRNFAEQTLCARRFVCPAGVVHDAYAVDGDRDVVIADASQVPSPSPTPRLDHGGGEHDRAGGLDGSASQILLPGQSPPRQPEHESDDVGSKRLVGALSTENDYWVDFVDVSGGEAWYQGNGDVFILPGLRANGAAWEVESWEA